MCNNQDSFHIQTNTDNPFIEVEHFQICKHNQQSPGDVFFSEKDQDTGRTVLTLSDGLGSGIKANVLATLTATMATKFVVNNIAISRAAEIIMNTLPVDKEKRISYATFTILDIKPDASVTIIEYDNPPYLLVRQKTIVEPIKECTPFKRRNKKYAPLMQPMLHYSSYKANPGDRIIFFSDGVSQAGLGTKEHPFGWGVENAHEYTLDCIQKNPVISARELAHAIVQKAVEIDSCYPKDDISCGVVYFRAPRDTLILTGPPMHPESDNDLVSIFNAFKGKKIISGGTTANIISRGINQKIKMDLKHFDVDIPPFSTMDGVDLITEGIITLNAVTDMLETGTFALFTDDNAATRMTDILMNSDRIYFVVGTKINEAHQDPALPESLEIRRNIIKRMASLLQDRYLKEIHIRYI